MADQKGVPGCNPSPAQVKAAQAAEAAQAPQVPQVPQLKLVLF